MYDIRGETPRPFEADYPRGASFNEQGRLTHDIEGRPLSDKAFVVGRTQKAADNPFPQTEFNALTEKTTGRGIKVVPKSEIGGNYGRVAVDDRSRRPLSIQLAKELTEVQARKVAPHELGHAVDQLAGEIPLNGLMNELKPLYNELNTGQKRTRNLMGPQHLKYKKEDIPREYMAEAIRAYMTSPNEMKTIAPKTAARIRKYVNSHPELKDIIQFNSIPLAAGIGLFGASFRDEETAAK